jgi:predicted MPP superfamily phosphohydrolase
MRNGLIVGGGLLGWTSLIEPFWLEVNHQVLSVPKLTDAWVDKRLVHISDFHTGYVNRSYLRRVVETVNSLEPDLLLFTGDLTDRRKGDVNLDAELGSVLSRLKPARILTLGTLGNHDYGTTYKNADMADEVIDIAERYGIRIVRNEKITLDGLDFFGLDDFWSPRFRTNLSFLQNEVDVNRPAICLCHNPDACDVPIWGDFQGCILSGHTHGGQCKPPFLPAPLLPVVNRRYTQGFFTLDARRQLYITRGVGYSMQVRFNCRPEITVFTLKASPTGKTTADDSEQA